MKYSINNVGFKYRYIEIGHVDIFLNLWPHLPPYDLTFHKIKEYSLWQISSNLNFKYTWKSMKSIETLRNNMKYKYFDGI